MDLGALWDFDDPAGSEARFRAAAEAANGDDRAMLTTQVARALGLQGRFGEGHEALDAIESPGAEVELRIALERGRLLRSEGNWDAALPIFRTASARAAEAGLEGLELDALHMIPLCLTGEEQLAATEHAIERARHAATPDGRRWLGSLLNNLGMAHADAGEWPRALATFEEALAERRAQGDADNVFAARWMVAWALRNLGRMDEAREAQLALKADLDAAGKADRYVDEELELLG